MLTINNLAPWLICIGLIWACYTDIRYRIISNKLVVTLLAIVAIWFAFGDGRFNYLAAVIFLVIGIGIFYLKLAGAGDIKLIVVLLLTLSGQAISAFFIITALCGIPLVLVMLIIKWLTKRKNVTLPYGVAISLGYLIVSAQIL